MHHVGCFFAVYGLPSCAVTGPEHMVSAVSAPTLANRILIPLPRIEPTSLALEGRFSTTELPRKPQKQLLGKILPVGRTLVVHLVTYFVWNERWPEVVCIYTNSWVITICLNDQGLESNRIRRQMTKNLGEEVCR